MNRERLLRHTALVLLLVAMVLLAAAAGILVRDVGASYRAGSSGVIDANATWFDRFYAYALTYELAVFSTVRVNTTVEALFSDWEMSFESNGSLLVHFRPLVPGVHQVVVRNLENRNGSLGTSIMQRNALPPELETCLLDPLLYATAVLFLGSVAVSILGRRYGRPKEERP